MPQLLVFRDVTRRGQLAPVLREEGSRRGGRVLEEILRHGIALAALGIEVMAVAVIVIAILVGTGRYLLKVNRWQSDAYETYKRHLAKALLLGLEFLVAADIVRTVALEPTLNSVAILGALVVIRTFLSWSLVVEMEGHWPWRVRTALSGGESAKRDA